MIATSEACVRRMRGCYLWRPSASSTYERTTQAVVARTAGTFSTDPSDDLIRLALVALGVELSH
jgi:hypothetical protein